MVNLKINGDEHSCLISGQDKMSPARLSGLQQLVKKWTTSDDIEVFALDSPDKPNNETFDVEQMFINLDDWIDSSQGYHLFSLAELVQGKPQKKKVKQKKLKSIAFIHTLKHTTD